MLHRITHATDAYLRGRIRAAEAERDSLRDTVRRLGDEAAMAQEVAKVLAELLAECDRNRRNAITERDAAHIEAAGGFAVAS